MNEDLKLLQEYNIEPTIDTIVDIIGKANNYEYLKTQDIVYNMFSLPPENIEYYRPAQRKHMIEQLYKNSRLEYMVFALKRSYSDAEIKNLIKKSIDRFLKDGKLN